MEEKQEYFDPRASLKQIESMIQTARNQISENGHLYLLWGWLVLFCALFQFFSIQFQWFEKPYYIWFLCFPALLYQIFYIRSKQRKSSVRTYTHRILSAVWMVFCAMGVVMYYQLILQGHHQLFYSQVLLLYGMPTILSGVIIQLRSLVVGGACCMLLAAISVHMPMQYQLLLLATAVIVAWIIPGYLLKAKFGK